MSVWSPITIRTGRNANTPMAGFGVSPNAGDGWGYAGHSYRPAPFGSGSRKLISNPLAMNASSRIYADSIPRLISGRGGIRRRRNDALRLLYAGRIQGQVL